MLVAGRVGLKINQLLLSVGGKSSFHESSNYKPRDAVYVMSSSPICSIVQHTET
jgi:hypothetical protein